ncbi:MAG: P1 family peptidase, partial [Chloroflexota bacterium]
MTLPPGFTVGHWTDPVAQTGCTVILCEAGATAGVQMGGGAPATIQTDIIGPTSATAILHAVLLTGGSAFGLAAYAGVMRYLEEQGVGIAVQQFRVPHVAGAVIFDLATGDGTVRPDADAGYAACRMATDAPAEGLVGAGTGAT